MIHGYAVDVTVLPAFLGAVAVICLTPGPDMAYLVGTGIAAGRSAATRAALGITVGVLVYTVAVAAGLGAVVADHPGVLLALQIFGCLYLGWLAIDTVRDARHAGPLNSAPNKQDAWFRRGLLVNLTNPKILLFFLAFLPQFLGTATNATLQLLMLGLLLQLAGLITDLVIGWSAGAIRDRVLARPRALRSMTFASAVVFATLAAYVASEAVSNLTSR